MSEGPTSEDDNASTLVQSEIRDVDFTRSSLRCGTRDTSKGSVFGSEEQEDTHSSSTLHSATTVCCRELRRNLYSSKEVFQRIPPLRIEWADESEVDRVWEHDDMFMRIILCISDICVLRWQLTEVDFLSEATIALTDVLPIRFSQEFSLYVDVTVTTVLCFSQLISKCFFNESWNRMSGEDNKILKTLSFVVVKDENFDSASVEKMPEILSAEEFHNEEMKFADDEELTFSYNESNEVLTTSDLQDSALSCNHYVLEKEMPEKYRSVLEFPQAKAMSSLFEINFKESFDGFLLDNILQVAATIMDVQQPLMQRNESLSNRIFETEKEISLDMMKKLNLVCQLHHSSILYSTQSICLELLDNEDTVVSLNVPDAIYKSPIVLSEVSSSLSEFDSLNHQRCEDSLLYTEDGRVCLGDNSSFSIMYTNRCHQPIQPEDERLQEIENGVREVPGMCDQDGDHVVDSDKKAKETATILKVDVNLHKPVGDSKKVLTSEDDRNQEFELEVPSSTIPSSTMRDLITTTQSEVPNGSENGAASLESPNRSFCFTSTPAQSSNASLSATITNSSVRSSMSSKNSRIPQQMKVGLNKPTDKVPGLGYPLPRGVQKNNATLKMVSGRDNKMTPSVDAKMGSGPSAMPKLKIGNRDTKMPRPPVPSNGEDSSRSTVLIPSSRVTSRMSEQSTSSSCHLPPSSSLKRKVTNTSLSSPKPSPAVATIPAKPVATRPAPLASIIPSKPIISSGGSNHGAKSVKPTTGPVAMNDADLNNFVGRIKAKLKGSKENQEEMAKMFNEALMGNSSFNFRENTLSSMQLAKVLSKFEPSMATYTIKDRQKIAAKLMNTKDQKVDLKTLMAACHR